MLCYNCLWINKCEFTKEGKTIMEKIKKRIANLKVAGKLKVYRMTVLVMTLFLVLVALISTLVIRSNISAGFRDNDCEIQNQTVSASGRIR